jgi:hypothetical protein
MMAAHDGRVDRAAAVATPGAAPLEDHDPGDERGIDRQIGRIAERGERHLAVQQ